MVQWNEPLIRARLSERTGKQPTPYRLAVTTGITEPAAARVLLGARVERIEASVLERICDRLDLTPNEALILTPGL